MKKLLTTLLLAMSVFCLSIGLVACGDKKNNDDGKITYTVTVTCEDAVTLATVKVKLVKEDNTDATDETALTNGSVSFKLNEGVYKVSLSGLLDRFDVPEVTLTPTANTATVALTLKQDIDEKDEVALNITVYAPDNTPMSNVSLLVCGTGEGASCVPGTTAANGKASFNLYEGEYEVHIDEEKWPEGYYFDNHTKLTVEKDVTEYSVSFYNLIDFTFCVNYTDAATYENTPAEGIEVAIVNTEKNLTFTGTSDAEGNVTINAPALVYSVDLPSLPKAYTFSPITVDSYYYENVGVSIYTLGTDAYYRIMVKAGETITVSDPKLQWYQFNQQNLGGLYKIESQGEVDVCVKEYTGSGSFVNTYAPVAENDDISETDKNFSLQFEVENDYTDINNIFAFRIYAKGSENTQPFTFTITRLGDIPETVYIDVDVEATQLKETLPEIPADTKVTYVDIDTDVIVYNEADGYYHLNDVNGRIVYATVGGTQYFPRTFDKNIYSAALEAGVGFKNSVQTPSNKYEYTTYNYIPLLEGYDKVANSQGLYPLTEEYKNFLQWYATASHNTDVMGWDYNDMSGNVNEKLYYFACVYYKDIYNTPEGSGTSENPYVLTSGEYKLNVVAGNVYFTSGTLNNYTVQLKTEGASLYNADGTAVEGNKLAITSEALSFYVAMPEGGDLMLSVYDSTLLTPNGSKINGVGKYLLNASYAGITYNITATEKGEYTLTCTDKNATLYVQDGESNIESFVDGTFKKKVNVGDTIQLVCGSWVGNTSYVVNVEFAPYVAPVVEGATVVTSQELLADGFMGTEYSFTAETDGEYVLVMDSANGAFLDEESQCYTEHTVTLKAGESVTVICSTWDMNNETYTVYVFVKNTTQTPEENA